MKRFLLVKKYFILPVFLLLISNINLKAEVSLCSFIYNTENIIDQLDPTKKKEPSFYPNPVIDIVNLTNQENVTRIRVMSLTGKTLIDITTPKKEISVRHLPKGMYLINFDLKDGKRIARKLVKK